MRKSIGAQLVVVLLLVLFSNAPAVRANAGGPWDEKAIYVTQGPDLYCTIDTTSIRRYTGLGGTTLVDVWANYRLDDAARERAIKLPGEFPDGLDVRRLRNISVRYLFRLDPADSEQPPLRVELEKRFTDDKGKPLGQVPFRELWAGTVWSPLGGYEQHIVRRLLTEPRFYFGPQSIDKRNATYIDTSGIDDGFLGRPWGTQPGGFPSARYISETKDHSIYHINTSVGALFGGVRAYAGAWLVFSKTDGLVAARISMRQDEADKVAADFNRRFGEIVLEKRPGELGDTGPEALWSVGRNSRAALYSKISNSVIEFSRANMSAAVNSIPYKTAAELEAKNRSDAAAYAQKKFWEFANEDGIFDMAWGSGPEELPPMLAIGSVHLQTEKIIFTDVGIPDTKDGTPRRTAVLLMFSPVNGLVAGNWEFVKEQRPQVDAQLRATWGEPISDKAGTVRWKIGKQAVGILDHTRNGYIGTVTIANEKYWQKE